MKVSRLVSRPWLAGAIFAALAAMAVAGCDASDLAGLTGDQCTPETCDYVVNTLVAAKNGSSVTLLADGGDNTLYQFDGSAWKKVGAETASVRSPLLASPAFGTDKTLFLGNSVSTNGGTSWQQTCATIKAISPAFASDKTIYGVDAAVTTGGTAAGTPGTSTNSCPSSTGSYYISQDNGQSWEAAQGPQGAGDPDLFVLSPTFATDKTIFATFTVNSDSALYKSTNSGGGWQKVLSGRQNIVALSTNYSQDHTIISVNASKVQRSTNGGSSWEDISSPIAAQNVAEIAFSPNFGDDKTVLLASAAEETTSTAAHGTYISTDGGKTWQKNGPVTQRLSNHPAIVFSPNYTSDKTLYASSLDQGKGPATSTDLGQNWTAINNGLPLVPGIGG